MPALSSIFLTSFGCIRPPVANLLLFIASRAPTPILLTLLFLITNSPGESIAGTVSRLPVPGTKPPLANAWILPPAPLRLGPIPVRAPKPGAKAEPIFKAIRLVMSGRSGSIASTILINAEAISKAPLATDLKVELSTKVRIKA